MEVEVMTFSTAIITLLTFEHLNCLIVLSLNQFTVGF